MLVFRPPSVVFIIIARICILCTSSRSYINPALIPRI